MTDPLTGMPVGAITITIHNPKPALGWMLYDALYAGLHGEGSVTYDEQLDRFVVHLPHIPAEVLNRHGEELADVVEMWIVTKTGGLDESVEPS